MKIILGIMGIIAAFVCIEGALRAGGVYYSYTKRTMLKEQAVRAGDYKILAIGESTTALGGADSWPSQLENLLNRTQSAGRPFTVINAGVPGTTSGKIFAALSDNLDRYRPSVVIAMVGLNDMLGSGQKPPVFLSHSQTYTFLAYIIDQLRKRCCKKQSGLTNDLWDAVELGNFWVDQQDFRKAEELYTHAITIDPAYIWSYIELANLYRNQNRLIEAKSMYRNALRIDSQNEDAVVELQDVERMEQGFPSEIGTRYRHQGRYAEKEMGLRAAIKQNPRAIPDYLNLAQHYLNIENFSKAKEILLTAQAVDPANAQVASMLTAVARNSGNDSKQGQTFLDTSYPPELALSYRRIKDMVLARGIHFIAVGYPTQPVTGLKKLLDDDRVLYVDNEATFVSILKNDTYSEYFSDRYAGSFGHASRKGNELIAKNIADVIKHGNFFPQ